jgi:mxaK protein
LLARALALAAAGQYEAARNVYNVLIRRGLQHEVGRSALLALGNMTLRQGMPEGNKGNGAGAAETNLALPMIELAKKHYRDLLRVDASQWDARYNLERALRLAPEEQAFSEPSNRPDQNLRLKLRGMQFEDLP